MSDDGALPLSVVIVARNEADRIGPCIESVLAACRPLEAFEVIVVDSNSSDRTVERAREYPVSILRIPEDDLSTAAAGRYVGARQADGEAVLFVDGDMVLEADWLPEALERLDDEDVAAVDGYLDDAPADASVRAVPSVRGVALYDADALEAVGGFDPYLVSLEDVHLGFELGVAGYRLLRLPVVVAHHPSTDVVTETFRRWRSGYTRGHGHALRRAVASPPLLARHLHYMRRRLAVGGWLLAGVASLATGVGLLAWLALSVVGFAVVARVRGGVSEAAGWVLFKTSLLAGTVLGLFDEPAAPEAFPMERVEVVREGAVLDGSSQAALF